LNLVEKKLTKRRNLWRAKAAYNTIFSIFDYNREDSIICRFARALEIIISYDFHQYDK